MVEIRKPCEMYVGSDFLGDQGDYEALKKDMETKPMPKKLRLRIAMDGRPPKIDDVKPCLQSPTTLLVIGNEGKWWVCEPHYKELVKYYEKNE